MAFNRDDYARIKEYYENKKKAAKSRAEERSKTLCAEIPELAEVQKKLAATGPRIYEAVMDPEGDLEGKIAAIRKENEILLEKQKSILAAHGCPEDWLDVKYDCPICSDEGNVNGKMCICMKKVLIEEGYKTAGIAGLAGTHNFDTFDLSYYEYDREVYSMMKYVFDRARNYAENFKPGSSKSVMFFGGTGLGKTHLSVAIAKRVIELENYVVYGTAQNVFSDFEYERFERSRSEKGRSDAAESRTAKYFDCDLLVIDDLGTEIKTQAVTAFLYNLMNTRIGEGKPMIINTNLATPDSMVDRYDERIASRLFGEFLPYRFIGTDVRMLKLKKGK